jgi:hypothetical protein
MRSELNLLGLVGSVAVFVACSAVSGGGIFGGADGTGGSGGTGGEGAPSPSGGSGIPDEDNISVGVGPSGSSGASGSGCQTDPDEDRDQDGFTVNDGDCNDCDSNVNPGAIEVVAQADADGGVLPPADEDCDQIIDNVLPTCDDNLALENAEPMSGANAIDLCQKATLTDRKWGVLDARYVRANGTTTSPGLQVGIQPNFGPKVNVQGGARLLAISSGRARTVGQTGACGSKDCKSKTGGVAPPGFPQTVPGCAGAKNINDDVGLEVKLRAPTNATGYSFDFFFYTFEYPEWVCKDYNDQFIALVSPPPAGSINGNISFDSKHNPVSVNLAFFSVCTGCSRGTSELQGTGFDVWNDAGGTSWLKTKAPVKAGQVVTIRFTLWDTGDQQWDSTTLIDNFQWIANGGTVVVGTDPIETPK